MLIGLHQSWLGRVQPHLLSMWNSAAQCNTAGIHAYPCGSRQPEGGNPNPGEPGDPAVAYGVFIGTTPLERTARSLRACTDGMPSRAIPGVLPGHRNHLCPAEPVRAGGADRVGEHERGRSCTRAGRPASAFRVHRAGGYVLIWPVLIAPGRSLAPTGPSATPGRH